VVSFGANWPRDKTFDNDADLIEFALEYWPTAREVTINVRSTRRGFGASQGIHTLRHMTAATTKSYRSFQCGKVFIYGVQLGISLSVEKGET
jgi:hypothetical protein